MKAWIFVSYTKGLADLGTMPFLADQNQNDEQSINSILNNNVESVPSGYKFDIKCPIEALEF